MWIKKESGKGKAKDNNDMSDKAKVSLLEHEN